MRKPVFTICEQQRRRSACASRQTDQRFCYSLLRLYNTSSFYIQNFKPLASLCSWVDGLSLTWSKKQKIGFLVMWLQYLPWRVQGRQYIQMISRHLRQSSGWHFPTSLQILSICPFHPLNHQSTRKIRKNKLLTTSAFANFIFVGCRQGRIQDIWNRGSDLLRGFDLINLPSFPQHSPWIQNNLDWKWGSGFATVRWSTSRHLHKWKSELYILMPK